MKARLRIALHIDIMEPIIHYHGVVFIIGLLVTGGVCSPNTVCELQPIHIQYKTTKSTAFWANPSSIRRDRLVNNVIRYMYPLVVINCRRRRLKNKTLLIL